MRLLLRPCPGRGYPGKAVSGRGNPRAGSLFRLFPIRWTVGGIASGGGADGEGAKAPAPVSGFNISASPTPPGLWPPPPPRGAGAVVAIPEEGRIRERKPPRQLVLQALPHTLDRGRYLHRGGADEEGRIRERKPTHRLPLQALPHTLDRGRYRLWGRGRRGGGKSPLPCLWFQYASTSAPVRSRYGLTRNYKGCEEGQTPAKISKDQVTTCKSAVTGQPGGLRGLA